MELFIIIFLGILVVWFLNKNKVTQNNNIVSDASEVSDSNQIIGDFGELITKLSSDLNTTFYDVSELPHPKIKIKEALISAIQNSNSKHISEQLEVGLLMLTQFQEDIGNQPIRGGIPKLDKSLPVEERIKKIAQFGDNNDRNRYDSLVLISKREFSFYKSLLK